MFFLEIPVHYRHSFFSIKDWGRFDSLHTTETIKQQRQLGLIDQHYTELLNIQWPSRENNMKLL